MSSDNPVDRESAYREAVGRTIKSLRAERGWSLRILSERADISVPYLSEIERGRKEPSGAMLAHLSAAFGLPLSHLLSLIASSLDRGALEHALTRGRVPPQLAATIRELDEEELAELGRFANYLIWRRATAGEQE